MPACTYASMHASIDQYRFFCAFCARAQRYAFLYIGRLFRSICPVPCCLIKVACTMYARMRVCIGRVVTCLCGFMHAVVSCVHLLTQGSRKLQARLRPSTVNPIKLFLTERHDPWLRHQCFVSCVQLRRKLPARSRLAIVIPSFVSPQTHKLSKSVCNRGKKRACITGGRYARAKKRPCITAVERDEQHRGEIYPHYS